MTPKEKKNKTIGYSISIGLHLLLLIAGGAAVMAWEAPGPPAEFPEVGIEIALGSDLEGMESEEEVDNESESDSDNQEEEVVEEDVPETTPEEDVPEPISDPEPTTPIEDATVEPIDPISDLEQPVTEENTSKPSESDATSENTNAESKPKTSSGPPKIFQGNGDKEGKQGQEDGVKDVKVYDGNLGGGSLGQSIGNIPGFAWKQKPKMDQVPFDATVKMKVVVNNLGEIITVKFVECPYTDPAIRKKIEEQLKKATLQATTQPDGNTVANITWAFKGK